MILIQHQLVSFTTTKPHQVLYKAEILAILGLIRYPRHVHTGRDLGEEIGELIIEDIIQHGQTPCSQVGKGTCLKKNLTYYYHMCMYVCFTVH